MTVKRLATELNKHYTEAIMTEMEAHLGILPTMNYIFFIDTKATDIVCPENTI
jgi:hypothetical protein